VHNSERGEGVSTIPRSVAASRTRSRAGDPLRGSNLRSVLRGPGPGTERLARNRRARYSRLFGQKGPF
jgi:hypothetical protein